MAGESDRESAAKQQCGAEAVNAKTKEWPALWGAEKEGGQL